MRLSSWCSIMPSIMSRKPWVLGAIFLFLKILLLLILPLRPKVGIDDNNLYVIIECLVCCDKKLDLEAEIRRKSVTKAIGGGIIPSAEWKRRKH